MHKAKIAIIGAGWVGCYIASELLKRGAILTVYDSSDHVFSGASGYNQNRIHLGFHHPRCSETINETMLAYKKFSDKFPQLVCEYEPIYYGIAKEGSLLSFDQYCEIMKSHGAEFEIVDGEPLGFRNLEGVIQVKEKVINSKMAASMFGEKLKSVLKLATVVNGIKQEHEQIWVNSESFDVVINCTYNQFDSFAPERFAYEACLMSVYKIKPQRKPVAITVMDGLHGSIYPLRSYDKYFYTVSSVKHTPFYKSESYYEAKMAVDTLTIKKKDQICNDIEDVMCRYYPQLKDDFVLVGTTSSTRTKLRDNPAAQRLFEMNVDGRHIRLFSPKISSIVSNSQEVCSAVEEIITNYSV